MSHLGFLQEIAWHTSCDLRRPMRTFPARALVLALLALPACVADTTEVSQQSDDLTSLSARSRTLRFDGYVYVSPGASDQTILETVQAQTQTMFGPLKNAEIGVNSRELSGVDPATFKKSDVTVIDTSLANDPGKPMVKVKYRYKDIAVVPVAMASRSAITLALMSPKYEQQTARILEECTANDADAQDFASSIWYVFDPSLSRCQDAMAEEQAVIDAARAELDDPSTQISKAELDRLYLPTTVSLGADKTNKGTDYPEYDKLFSGGVEPGKLVIGLVNGFIDHSHTGSEADDSGYDEWMEELRETMANGPAFALTAVEPAEDLTSFTVNGKKVTGAKFTDLLAWELDGKLPAGLKSSDRSALKKAVGQKLVKHWITLEAPMQVKIGKSGATKPFTVKIQSYFGAESSSTPHKRAIKTSDVFIYNGHSYIGYGPLDPSQFSASDFPPSYQILFIDGCVSFNYYEKDYFPLKTGGTANLELITNGLEAPAYKSGYALGRFLNTLLGAKASYKDLLAAAEDTDSLRVVDGEVDNKYTPSKKPITLTY